MINKKFIEWLRKKNDKKTIEKLLNSKNKSLIGSLALKFLSGEASVEIENKIVNQWVISENSIRLLKQVEYNDGKINIQVLDKKTGAWTEIELKKMEVKIIAMLAESKEVTEALCNE